MGVIWEFIVLVVVGAIFGGLARLLIPGKQQMGILITIVLGAAGALIGRWAAGYLEVGTIIRWIISIAVAVVLVLLYTSLTRKGTRT